MKTTNGSNAAVCKGSKKKMRASLVQVSVSVGRCPREALSRKLEHSQFPLPKNSQGSERQPVLTTETIKSHSNKPTKERIDIQKERVGRRRKGKKSNGKERDKKKGVGLGL